MPTTVSFCPLCGSGHSAHFDRRTFRGQPVVNRLCQSCGLVYQSPRMHEAELGVFYEAEYRQLYQGGEGPDAKDLSVQSRRAEALLAFCKDQLPPVKRHLDIGCSAGLLLQHFQAAYGCQAIGIEPGAAYRQYARHQGLTVFASLDEFKSLEMERFDLVSMAHVLEHLPDPLGYLEGVRKNLLESRGWLLVEVPNLYAHNSFEVAHLVSYSAHTLRQTLGKAGFEVTALEAHGRPRSRLLPLYLTALARPLEKPTSFQVQPESRVRLKRWWGMSRRRVLERLFPRQAWLPLSSGRFP